MTPSCWEYSKRKVFRVYATVKRHLGLPKRGLWLRSELLLRGRRKFLAQTAGWVAPGANCRIQAHGFKASLRP